MRCAGPAPPRPFPIAALCFLLSGAGVLIVETVWMRWLRLLLGASAPAASATLVAFLLGQVLGATLAARRVARAARPLRAYGWLELAAASWALAVPAALAAGEAALGLAYDRLTSAPAALGAARFSVALLATLPAAVAFGATLPVLVSAVAPGARALGRRGGGLYALHLLGGVVGTAVAALWLPPLLGVAATHRVGVGLLAGAGLLALAASRREPAQERAHDPRASKAPRPSPVPVPVPPLVLAAVSGFATFAVQVLLVQAFGLVLDQSVLTFGCVLIAVLASLGVGAAAAARLGRAKQLLGVGLAGAALLLVAFPAVFAALSDGLRPLAARAEGAPLPLRALALALIAAGPPLVFAGLVFPSLLGLAEGRGHPGEQVGRLLAANTAGALAGCVAAPYLLVPALGLWPAFAALGALYGVAAWLAPPGRTTLFRLALPVALLALAAAGLPRPAVRLEPGTRAVDVRATASGVVAVLRRDGELLLQIDNHYSLGGVGDLLREERQGHLPLLLHGAPRELAYVGAATGISVGAATLHPIERGAVVELVPAVARAAERYFAPWNRGVYRDPRFRVVLDDGRNFLRFTGRRFDVVVADLFVPWRAGTGAMYTAEHFAAVRARLAGDGLFCQWLPLYQLTEAELRSILATFLDVFPDAALWRGDFFARHPIVALVGFAGRPAAPERVDAAVRRLADRGVPDRWMTHPLGFWSLYAGPLAPLRASLADAPRNRDDRPTVEFASARSHARADARPATGERWLAVESQVLAAAPAPDPLHGALGSARLRAREAGLLLRRADTAWTAGADRDASRALEAAARRLPSGLLDAGAPDPSVVSVWPGEGG